MPSLLDRIAAPYFAPPQGMEAFRFDEPKGAPALFAPDSVTWRVFANPVALVVGGIAAVLMELAEPRVRHGVWEHTSFRRDPVTRIRRTGYAAMVTVYAPAETAQRMIEGVNAAHARISGIADNGQAYRADDPELLNWVQATASFGFLEAYCAFVRPLSNAERDQFYLEAQTAATLYGATGALQSVAEQQVFFARMTPKLTPSSVISEFLDIMDNANLLPSRTLQRACIRAAASLLPKDLQAQLHLEHAAKLGFAARSTLLVLANAAEHLALANAPAALAGKRIRFCPSP